MVFFSRQKPADEFLSGLVGSERGEKDKKRRDEKLRGTAGRQGRSDFRGLHNPPPGGGGGKAQNIWAKPHHAGGGGEGPKKSGQIPKPPAFI